MAELRLREFGLLVQGVRNDDDLAVCGIESEQAWAFFEGLAFSDDKDDRFIDTARFEGRKALRVKNFVGVICAPDGTQVEILPKTSEGRGGSPVLRKELLAGPPAQLYFAPEGPLGKVYSL